MKSIPNYKSVQVYINLLILLSVTINAQTNNIPSMQIEGELKKRAAEAYFEALHVVPPGYNWKLVNEAVREQRYSKHAKAMESVQADTPRVTGSWQEVGSANQAGRVVCVEFDAATNRVWTAGAGGTIWLGNLAGTEWKILNDPRRIPNPQLIKNVKLSSGKERLVVVSSAARSFYLDEGSSIWKQATGLEEMQRWGSFQNAVSCQRNGALEIYAYGDEWDYGPMWKSRRVLYRSSDSGRSFERLRWFDGQGALWTDGTENVVLINDSTFSFVLPDGSIEDHGKSGLWKGASQILLAGADVASLMVARVAKDSTGFYVSYDAGEQWEYQGSLKFTPFDKKSFHQTTGFSRAWLYGGVDVYRSIYEGASWNRVNSWGQYYNDPAVYLHADIPSFNSFKSSSGKTLTFICTDGGLFVSDNEVQSVKNISLSGLNISQYYSSFTSRDNVNVIYAGSQDQGFQRTRDYATSARNFRQLISGDYSSIVSGDMGHNVFCVYPGFVMFIPNAEDGWAPMTLDFVHRNHLWLPPLASLNSNPRQVLLGGGSSSTGAYLYRYEAFQDSIRATKLPFDFGNGATDVRITAVATFGADDSFQYVVTSANKVFFSSDRGLTWTQGDRPAGLREHYFSGNAIAIDNKNASLVYIGGSGYDGPGVYVSENKGESFKALAGLPPCLVLGLAVGNNGRYIAAATDVGAFVYDTLLHAWSDVTSGSAPDQTYWDVDWIEPLQRFRFCTYGRGIWDFIPGAPVDVAEAIEPLNQDLSVTVRKMGTDVMLDVNVGFGGVAQITWYDLEGRLLTQQDVDLNQGNNSVSVPQLRARTLFAVVKSSSGNIRGCVVNP
jgi:hypothetical protein